MSRELFPNSPRPVTTNQIHCDGCNKGLYERDKQWFENGRDFRRGYGFWLEKALPKPYLEAQLKLLGEQDPAVVIDLFGSRRAMNELRNQYLIEKNFKAGIVRWWDHRKPDSIEAASDEIKGISVIPGDLRSSESWDGLASWLGGDKANLILELSDEHLMFIPHRLSYYQAALTRLWDVLSSQNGLMVLQIPDFDHLESKGIDIEGWLGRVQGEGIFSRYVPDVYIPQSDFSWIISSEKSGYGLLTLMKESSQQELPE